MNAERTVNLREPVHALVDSFTIYTGACDDAPVSITQFPELERFRNLTSSLSARLRPLVPYSERG